MTFGEWFVRRGRMSRRVWWLHYALPIIGLSLVAAAADSAFGYPGLFLNPVDSDGVYAITGGPFGTLILVGTLVPSVSSTVTRLHDRDHSAWWLLWALLPLVGCLVLFVQNGFLRGQPGANQYGPAPLERESGDLSRSV